MLACHHIFLTYGKQYRAQQKTIVAASAATTEDYSSQQSSKQHHKNTRGKYYKPFVEWNETKGITHSSVVCCFFFLHHPCSGSWLFSSYLLLVDCMMCNKNPEKLYQTKAAKSNADHHHNNHEHRRRHQQQHQLHHHHTSSSSNGGLIIIIHPTNNRIKTKEPTTTNYSTRFVVSSLYYVVMSNWMVMAMAMGSLLLVLPMRWDNVKKILSSYYLPPKPKSESNPMDDAVLYTIIQHPTVVFSLCPTNQPTDWLFSNEI